jgi:hypothetical protein
MAAPFLEIPVSARALSMGGAFTGVANDASSLFWNPAGIARLTQHEVIFQHTNWIADTKFDYAGLVISLGELGTIGASFTALSMDDMLVRTEQFPEGTGLYFSAGDIAVSLAYARNLTDRFSIGFNVKYINQRIWHETAQGFALDIGTLFVTDFFGGMRIGGTLSNFGTNMKMDGADLRQFHAIDPTKLGTNQRIPESIETDSWPLPLNFQFGLATEIVKSEKHRLTVAIDALHPSDNYESINVGGEYAFQDMFFARGGYQSLFLKDGEGGLSLGAGLKGEIPFTNASVMIDYSFNDFGRLKGVHTVSLGVRF